jgi:hypothetical protein
MIDIGTLGVAMLAVTIISLAICHLLGDDDEIY